LRQLRRLCPDERNSVLLRHDAASNQLRAK
jgi:hypothetical protein